MINPSSPQSLKWLEDEKQATDFARKRGQRMGLDTRKKYGPNVKGRTFDTLLRSEEAARYLEQLVDRDGPLSDILYLSVEWALEKFWGLEIKRILPALLEIHQMLVDRGHDLNNRYIYNDLDYSMWYESAEKNKKVMIFDSQGDSYVIIIHDRYPVLEFDPEIHVRKVYPRVKRSGTIVVQRSLAYMRKEGWKPDYGDARDRGYEFSYINHHNGPKVDFAYQKGGTLQHWVWWIAVNYEQLKSGEGSEL